MTTTQVMALMMNKYRGRMVQGDYIMGNIFHKEGIEKLRKETIARKKCICTLFTKFTLAFASSDMNI